MTDLGKWLFFAGLALAFVGGAIWLLGRTGLPIGRLPGDIRIERGSFVLYFPLVSCLLGSLILTLALNLIARLFNR